MKTLFRALVALVLLFSPALTGLAQDVPVYFTREEMTDLVACLPAPPDTTDSAFSQDILRYMWGKAQRRDPERAAQVCRDAIWNLDTLAVIFSEPFGLEISREATPAIYKVFTSGVATIGLIGVGPKAHFLRVRPFVYFQEPMLTRFEEESLRGEGSYPSGHTLRGWSAALILAEINPGAAEASFARGWRYGENRVIAGAHWQSDVTVSRPASSIGYVKLQTSPAFRRDMEAAKAEFSRLIVEKYYLKETEAVTVR